MSKLFLVPVALLALVLIRGGAAVLAPMAVRLPPPSAAAAGASAPLQTAPAAGPSAATPMVTNIRLSAASVPPAPRVGAVAERVDLYVSTAGSDSNPGTEMLPFLTIEKAASAAVSGSTVHVAPGQYNGTIHTRTAGNASGRIRYVATIKWGARLLGQGKDAVWTNHGDHVVISGFDISGSGRIGILNLGSHTLIENNHVHHMAVSGGCTADGGAGIDNGNFAGSDGDVVGNIVHDIGMPGSCNGVHGIYSSNQGGHIINNLVYRVAAYGIHLWHAATSVTVANNTLFANGAANMGGGIVMGNGDGPGGSVLNHTRIVNNIVYDNPAASIKEFCYPRQECTGATNTVANNLTFNNGQAISLRRGRAKNTISADPQFVDYRADGSGNYALKATSPAIARGIRLAPLGHDTSGAVALAPRGKRGVDIGASVSQVPPSF